jgi:hypothetical protein
MPHNYPKRSQLKCTKKPYRIRNWRDYEAALRRRGELTLWFSEEAIETWHAEGSSKPGGQRIYSDLAIGTALTVRSVYRLGLRRTEGFLRSVSALLRLRLRIPDHSTLSRRSKQLDHVGACARAAEGPLHILIDSTGLRVHAGNRRQDPPPRRRMWRKLHLIVDAGSGEILASDVTTQQVGDVSRVPELLDQVQGELSSLTADGAYDAGPVYEAIETRRSRTATQILIPPRRKARLSGKSGMNPTSSVIVGHRRGELKTRTSAWHWPRIGGPVYGIPPVSECQEMAEAVEKLFSRVGDAILIQERTAFGNKGSRGPRHRFFYCAAAAIA